MFLIKYNLLSISVLKVERAVYIVMGANIGTSVTNTIVSLAQSAERNEFRRAFQGAVVHDIFNWLSVIVFLPLEVITGYLQRLTAAVVNNLHLETRETNQKLLKVVTEPFAKLIIQIDKEIIKNIALGDEKSQKKSLIKSCVSKTEKIVTLRNETTGLEYIKTVIETEDTCTFLFKGTSLSDTDVGVILLVFSIALLCICLICIVRLLHSMPRGQMAKVIKKTINAVFPGLLKWLKGFRNILVIEGMTMLLQSSSIFRPPLISHIRVWALTIGDDIWLVVASSIGPTATGILAAWVSSSNLDRGLQVAFCGLFYNISNVILLNRVQFMLPVGIRIANSLRKKAAGNRWFVIAYMIIASFLLSAAVFGLSLAGWWILVVMAVPFILLFLFVVIPQRRAPGHRPEAEKLI